MRCDGGACLSSIWDIGEETALRKGLTESFSAKLKGKDDLLVSSNPSLSMDTDLWIYD